MDFTAAAADLSDDLVALRRDLHRIPELGLECPDTQAAILAALEGLDLEITTGTGCTSVTAVLRGGRPGPAVLLRGDLDGLPVAEQADVDYASTNGRMHACGHDLHVAGLVGAARLLAARREELPGTVVFMFQPGEEGSGGARVMIEEGVLDAAGERVVAAYGVHVATGEYGRFSTRTGPLMAGANELDITVHGRGGHGSQPQTSLDPVPALLEIGTALQAMVTRRFSVFDPVVLTVTQLSAGEARNVIPPSASLGATVRTLSQASIDTLTEETRRLAEGIAAAHGCTASVDFRVDYPVTMNDTDEAAFVGDVVTERFGAERFELMADPLMGSEDFSYVLEQVPGAFVFLGCTPPETDWTTAPWNHSPLVVFDDGVLADQAALLAELAWRRLER
ncbi:M20 metallopeptidase family protein [Propioniciclava soli]|uniref:M20 metallopeptidase family protein n=1 Tax=Propioniciclava soli TaxID=2775081 RepID=UPI001E620AF2|nr:M20 family metallopeptidase [Propioniciclava soli]